MTIRVLVNGATGKMGQITIKTVTEDAELTLVGAIHRPHDLAKEITATKADVVIDFTEASLAFHHTLTILQAGAHPVIGTSGLKKADVKTLEKEAQKQKLGGIIAPNFSIGAILMMKYAAEMAAYFPQVEIIEMHHDGKLDSPSGTALRTAEMLAEKRMNPLIASMTKEIIPGSRGALYQDIPIHALRLKGVLAEQQVIFGNIGETLTLRHATLDRQCFMPGVILACKKVMSLNTLVYGLETIL